MIRALGWIPIQHILRRVAIQHIQPIIGWICIQPYTREAAYIAFQHLLKILATADSNKKGSMVHKFIISMAAAVFVGTCSGQTFKDTAVSFRKMEAKTRAGVSMNGYADAMADVEFSVGEYAAGVNERNKPNAEGFKKALLQYQLAGIVWTMYNKARRGEVLDKFGPEISNDYCPGVAVNVRSGISECLSQMWEQAKLTTDDLHEVPDTPEMPSKAVKAVKPIKKVQ